ncbi:hypothetical protein SDC9_136745 [bioreactor metagenome]|uniref:Uncharacterized protein n=1 Tax=bioreactor metagenome TaxID=1076179 RepID=A0A645DLG2_9ZZZZ
MEHHSGLVFFVRGEEYPLPVPNIDHAHRVQGDESLAHYRARLADGLGQLSLREEFIADDYFAAVDHLQQFFYNKSSLFVHG